MVTLVKAESSWAERSLKRGAELRVNNRNSRYLKCSSFASIIKIRDILNIIFWSEVSMIFWYHIYWRRRRFRNSTNTRLLSSMKNSLPWFPSSFNADSCCFAGSFLSLILLILIGNDQELFNYKPLFINSCDLAVVCCM
jgi:hypothetical protein